MRDEVGQWSGNRLTGVGGVEAFVVLDVDEDLVGCGC